MIHPLAGARFKVVRAQEHLCTLTREIRGYLDIHPYTLPVQKDLKHSLIGISYPILTCEPPLSIGAILGDCLTNVRAALDYVVWQLAMEHAVPALNPDDRRDRKLFAMPIQNVPRRKDDGLDNKINGLTNRKIPAAALSLIEDIQPHNAGYEPLWWLHELVNEDKHRVPLVGVASIERARVFGSTLRPGGRMDFLTNPETGTEWSDIASVKVDGQVTIFVTLQNVAVPRVPVDRTLEQIIETVANIIPRFDRFF